MAKMELAKRLEEINMTAFEAKFYDKYFGKVVVVFFSLLKSALIFWFLFCLGKS